MSLKEFIESKLNNYAETIVDSDEELDEYALGELTFYMTLRRILSENATLQDKGMLDAINDTLQELEIIKSNETFYKR